MALVQDALQWSSSSPAVEPWPTPPHPTLPYPALPRFVISKEGGGEAKPAKKKKKKGSFGESFAGGLARRQGAVACTR